MFTLSLFYTSLMKEIPIQPNVEAMMTINDCIYNGYWSAQRLYQNEI